MITNSQAERYILDHIAPSEQELQKVRSLYEELKSVLFQNTFRTGSCRRGTTPTPINDLDVIYRTGATSPVDAEVKMKEATAKLIQYYHGKATVKPQSHSIGIFFGEEDEFSMDVVPAFVSGKKNDYGDDIFYVPEIAHKSVHNRRRYYQAEHLPINWILSDPKGYISMIKDVQDKNSSFRPSTILLKKWRRNLKEIHGDDLQLKSFHMELVVAELATNETGADCLTLSMQFFEKLIPYYIEQKPLFKDRANPGRFVDDYEISDKCLGILQKHVARGRLILEKIRSAKSESEVASLIEELINTAPKYDTNVTSTHKPHKPHARFTVK